jgi:hypothetical protein
VRSGQYRFVILSRGRAATLPKHTLRFFPQATVLVHHREIDDYAKIVSRDQIVGHGDVRSYGDLCCQALDTFDEELLMLLDDDLLRPLSNVGRDTRAITDPVTLENYCLNAAECARGVGACLFSFPNCPPVFFNPLKPISFSTQYLPGFQGIIGRKYRHDPELLYHTDADLCLQVMTGEGLIYVDRRVSFLFMFNDNPGGNNLLRMQENQQRNYEYLLRKWGPRAKSFLIDEERIAIKRRSRSKRGQK